MRILSRNNLNYQQQILTAPIIIMQYVVINLIYIREYCLYFRLYQIAAWLFIGMFVSFSYLLFLSCFSAEIPRFKLRQIYVAVIGIALFLSIFLSAYKVIGFDFIIKGNNTIAHVLLILFLLSLNRIKANKGIFCYTSVMNVILSILQLIMAIFPTSYSDGKLIYYYSNSNECGLSLFLTGAYLFVYMVYRQEKRLRYVLILLLLLCEIILCYFTGSRTALVALILALTLFLILKKKNRLHISLKVITFAIVMSFIFPLIWLMIYGLTPYKSITVLRKPLFSGREDIWISMINTIFKNPFRSHYNELIVYVSGAYTRLYSPDYGPHNAFWSILWNYNIIILILFLWLMNRTIREAISNIDSIFKMAIGTVVISLLFMMTFETSLLSSGFNYVFRAFYLLVLLKSPIIKSVID